MTPRIETGDFHDNAALFEIAVYRSDNGDREGATSLLETLRDRILRDRDGQSVRWLLRPIEEKLSSLKSEPRQSRTPAFGALDRLLGFLHDFIVSKAMILGTYSVVVLSLYIAAKSLEQAHQCAIV